MPEAAVSNYLREVSNAPKLLYTIAEACGALGVKKSTLYNLVSDGRLRMVKLGKLSMVPDDSIRALVAGLPDKGPGLSPQQRAA